MKCNACEGDGWQRRLVAHPGKEGHYVTVTKLCRWCSGTGIAKPVFRHDLDTDQNNLHLSAIFS